MFTLVVIPLGGISFPITPMTIEMVETGTNAISDILNISTQPGTANPMFQFASDIEPLGTFAISPIVGVTPSTVVENGASQNLFMLSQNGLTITVNATSELESVPEPSTLTLLGLGGIGLLGYAYRRRKLVK